MRQAGPRCAILPLLLACHAAPGGADGPPGAAARPGCGPQLVLRPSALHLQASAAPHVPHPHDGGAVANVVARLERGDRVVAEAAQPGWTRVRGAAGTRGWVPAADLLPDAAQAKATVMRQVPYFPDPQAEIAAGTAPAGTLLLVAEHGEPRSRVDVPEHGAAYVETAELSFAADDVEMSHLIGHAAAADPVEAAETLDEARVRFAGSPLLEALAEHVEFGRLRAQPAMPTSKMNRPPR